MRKIRDVLRQALDSRLSLREVAKRSGISRDAVKDYLTRFEAAHLPWPLPPELDDAALELRLFPILNRPAMRHKPVPDWSAINAEMKKKGATIQILHKEYLTDYPDGMAYSSFCQRYREFTKKIDCSMRQHHRAGEKLFVDYVGKTMPVIDIGTRETRQAQIFVGVLGASNYIFAEAVWTQELGNWIASHTRMFEHIGGVPELVICDNLKSAVTRASRTNPEINPTYLAMASHYGTDIVPARAYRPKDKAKAENGVLIVEREILFPLRNEIFTSLAELNQAIQKLLVDLNNRPFTELPGCRLEALEKIDRPALKPLPVSRYEYAEFRIARVGKDYHVKVDGHFYSVPHSLNGQQVDLRISADTVEVLHKGRRVASHARRPGAGATTDPLHMPEAHRHLAEWSPQLALDWAAEVGPHTHAFMQVLMSTTGHQMRCNREYQKMRSMGKKYGLVRLEDACQHGNLHSATKTQSVESILVNNIDRHASVTDPVHEASFDHENIRGPASFQ